MLAKLQNYEQNLYIAYICILSEGWAENCHRVKGHEWNEHSVACSSPQRLSSLYDDVCSLFRLLRVHVRR